MLIETLTRTRWVFPSIDRLSPSGAIAGRSGRWGPSGCKSYPIMRRSAGRANNSKLTIELTGLPGRPKTGLPWTIPNANGLAGLMAICIHRIGSDDCALRRLSTTLMKSKSPMLTPPLVTSASHRLSPSVIRCAISTSSSRTKPRSSGSQPASRTRPSRVSRFESLIWPGPSGVGASTNSSPVDSTPTTGRRQVSTSWMPMLASTPRCPATSRVPATKAS